MSEISTKKIFQYYILIMECITKDRVKKQKKLSSLTQHGKINRIEHVCKNKLRGEMS